MAAQISLSIALISIAIISCSGYILDRTTSRELREENELILITNLAFIRDDLVTANFDMSRAAQQVVDRTERRVYRLHAAILDELGSIVARSPGFPLAAAAVPQRVLATKELPAKLTVEQVGDLRERFAALATIWVAPDQRRYRVLFGRVALPVTVAAPSRSILVALAIETFQTAELRARDLRETLAALSIAALLAVLFGIWVARRIVVGAKRLGVAASRISAEALHDRLPIEGVPTELVESTLAFNRMLDRLQRAFERLSAFSSDLAHDLRTPIGNLLGEAQVALSRPRSADEYRVILESAVEEYERLSRTIGNMLFLARADNEQVSVSADRVAARTALERVMAYFEQVAQERGVTLQAMLDASPGVGEFLWADEGMLIRALSNLVSNALRYATRGTRVDLSATIDASQACVIQVSNEGPAIAAEHQSLIFDRFFRGEASREDSASGSGLGLAIVRSIMELHGGKVTVRSAPGERTVFRLEFPPPTRSTGLH
jgi:two-component system heavy metal sensor histidine kinase CusS